ncbi:MAG: hypothetical protein NZ602_05860 [Thermoguttaceae bacterium]|nr:hypothetical protein [Thermoguttaceae bacterium]MDW8038203.1 hypothetical protein [Thermoguttaceae bacterium]
MASTRGLWILLLLGGVGCWYVWKHYELKGLEQLFSPSRALRPQSSDPGGQLPPVPTGRSVLLVASFNAHPLDAGKLSHPARLAALVQLLRRFDLVALQNIQLQAPGLLWELRDHLNTGGRYYEVAFDPESFQQPGRPVSAFLYDRATVEIDLAKLYSMEDLQGRLYDRPLVGSFRARGPHPSQAFTFILISVYIQPERADQELPLIEQLYRTVRKNSSGEDDILLAGTLPMKQEHLQQWAKDLQLTAAVGGSVARLPGESLWVDNILFVRRATVEYTGRSGMVDLVRELGLSVQEAMELSEHWPVWMELSVYEGGVPDGVVYRPVCGLP